MKSTPLQTELDFTLVKQYILLPLALDVIDHDVRYMQISPLKMTNVYIKNLEQVQRQVHEDLVRVRKQMRAHGLKVYEEKKSKMSIDVKYICRGYHHNFGMLWSLVKSDIEELLAGYMNVNLDE